MQYYERLVQFDNNIRTAVTLGKFDGLHRGHEKLIEKVIECADDDIKSVVCAFDMVPFFRERNKEHKILMTKEDKLIRLSDRVDYFVDCPFTTEFSRMSAEDFIKDVLVGLFHAQYVIVGTDFCFGYKKSGNVDVLEQYQETYGYKLIVIEKKCYQNREISSTYVKEAIRNGDIALANRLLGYSYTITGTVEHGKKLGRALGFPTMNVVPEENKLMPPNGVYMLKVCIDGKDYPAIGNIGVKPTVSNEQKLLVESFLLHYSGDAYGKEVHIELLEFRRPEMKFSSIEEMKQVVDNDIEFGKHYFSNLVEK